MTTITKKNTADTVLLAGLQRHALKLGDVELSNGTRSHFYVDVKQAMLVPSLARLAGTMIAKLAHDAEATAVGGMIVGAIPIGCAALTMQPGDDLVAFIVRKERKDHGLQRWIEGPDEFLQEGTRCLVVDDVVTTGTSTIEAIEKIQDAGLVVAGVVSIVDRLAGGKEAIEKAANAPFQALVTIRELYPDYSRG